MKTRLQSALVAVAIAIYGCFATTVSVEAAVYRGRFDPTYGTPFNTPALGWAGSLEVIVDDSCVQPGFVLLLSPSCGGSKFQITEAEVYLYRAGTDTLIDGIPDAPRQTLDFRAAAGPNISGLGWGLNFGPGGMLLGANSTAFPALQGVIEETLLDAVLGPTTTKHAFFSLQFLGQYAQLYWFEKEPSAAELLTLTTGVDDIGICRDNGVTTIPSIPAIPFLGIKGYAGNKCGWSDPENIDQLGAFIRFTQVPEPTTVALVPAALALMGLVGLRTRRRISRNSLQ